MKKNFIFISLFILLVSCDYQPLYRSANLQNINYKIIEQKGDQQINKMIVSDLKRYSSTNNTKVYRIILDTLYNKSITAKNSFGSPTNYVLSATSKITVETNEKNISFSISEKFNYKNLQENYEQANYENIIKKNLASNISEKMVKKLARIK